MEVRGLLVLIIFTRKCRCIILLLFGQPEFFIATAGYPILARSPCVTITTRTRTFLSSQYVIVRVLTPSRN